MFKNFTKIFLLIFCMASTISLTSCKKDNPKPQTQNDKYKDPKDPKNPGDFDRDAYVEQLVGLDWQHADPYTDPKPKFYGFKLSPEAEGKVSVFKDVLLQQKANGTYTLSKDARTITITIGNDVTILKVKEVMSAKILDIIDEEGNEHRYSNNR